jgi:hypothetical protein
MDPMATVEMDFHAALQQLFAPYTFANGATIRVTVSHVYGLDGIVEIDTMLKPYKLPADPTPRQVRSALMESANRAIDAVEAFGFRHYDAPRIDFSGQVAHRMGKAPLVVTECGLHLNLYPSKAEDESGAER